MTSPQKTSASQISASQISAGPLRKLLVHIGHHKTGSTSVQYAFATGRVQLAGGRILYPAKLTHNYLRRHVDVYAQEGRLLPGAPGMPDLPTIAGRMARGDYEVAVISGEEFEAAEPAQLRSVMAEFLLPHVGDHAVICYVRPHAGRLLSSFAERLKLGLFQGTPQMFHARSVQDGRFRYAPGLARWQAVFGAHLRLRPMIRDALAGGSVLQDFIETGFPDPARVSVAPGPAANESLCLEDLVVLRLVQDALAARGPRLRHAMGWELAESLGRTARNGAPGTRLALHRSLAETIRRAYLEDADMLDQQFFGQRGLFRRELDRAVDEALPQAQSHAPEDHFTPETLRLVQVLAGEIDRMLDHDSGPWPAYLHRLRVQAVHGEGRGEDWGEDRGKEKGAGAGEA